MKPKVDVSIPLFGGTLTVAYTNAEGRKQHRRLYPQFKQQYDLLPPGKGGWTHYCDKKELKILVVILEARSRPMHRVSVCVHEAVHCAQLVARSAMMNPLNEEESFAYLTQWFFEQILG